MTGVAPTQHAGRQGQGRDACLPTSQVGGSPAPTVTPRCGKCGELMPDPRDWHVIDKTTDEYGTTTHVRCRAHCDICNEEG